MGNATNKNTKHKQLAKSPEVLGFQKRLRQKYHHLRSKCRFRNVVCRHCKLRGHIARVCKKGGDNVMSRSEFYSLLKIEDKDCLMGVR